MVTQFLDYYLSLSVTITKLKILSDRERNVLLIFSPADGIEMSKSPEIGNDARLAILNSDFYRWNGEARVRNLSDQTYNVISLTTKRIA